MGRDLVVFFTILISLSSKSPHLPLANTINPSIQRPSHGMRGNDSDYQALLAIKAQISDDPNSVLSSWNNSLHFCQWKGVTCGHRHIRVVSLHLPFSNLVGALSPFIGNISFLRDLNLRNNFFRGNIPHQISHLDRLRTLVLTSNSFEGEIPANLSRCSSLITLLLNRNNLVGKIPIELVSLPNLVIFSLGTNKLSGRLQDIGIGNTSTSLQSLFLDQNHLLRNIPEDIGRLKSLSELALGDNMLSSTIPTSFFNLSRLNYIYLSNTKIHGNLPQDLGIHLPHLCNVYIANTSLTGQIPTSLSNLSELEVLDISVNSFKGRFYLNGNNFPRLLFLNIDYAFLEAKDLSFLDTLTNCTNLTHLVIPDNSFTGTLPHSILNLSSSLLVLDVKSNQISGQLPSGLGKFVNLYALDLRDNHFLGPIPKDIGKLERMENLDFSFNNFSGEIPSSLGNLTRLSTLSLEYNNLEGSIPKSLGNCKYLQALYLYSNNLGGVLPVELVRASDLISLAIGLNNLQGPLPAEISSLKLLSLLDVSQNRFSGEIPSTLGRCMSLTFLYMNKNSFFGSIPSSFSALKSIQELDLSYNNLSGKIPNYFSNWPYLLTLNLSFNSLEGEVPTNGVFANTSAVSVIGNKKLCGGVIQLQLPKCPQLIEPKRRRLPLAIVMIISIVCALILLLSIALCYYLLFSSRKSKNNTPFGLQTIKPLLEVSYQMLSRATNGFSPSNLIGAGSFGYVYKGTFSQDDTEMLVAVKVMNLHNDGASKSFIAECRTLRNIRHRNLVKIITACSGIDAQHNDFKALVFEFMPRGSLEDWLHPSNHVTNEHVGGNQPCNLSLAQRLSITVDVACALEYLHLGCASSIIHCDLKPSNILLDDEMTARVGDFGLAKFLPGASTSNSINQSSSTQIRGTVGYAAPEYGLGSKVSLEGDIYSFGFVVLEMMTSKKPTDPMFKDGLNLHDFAKSALPDRVMEVIDQGMIGDANLLYARNVADIKKLECIKSLIMIGVQCSLELPQE